MSKDTTITHNQNEDFDNHVFDNEHDIIGDLYEIATSFNKPHKAMRYLYKYQYFHSNTIKDWISDYYEVQKRLVSKNTKFPNTFAYMVPSDKGTFIWVNKCFKCSVRYNWCEENYGSVFLQEDLCMVYDKLKFMYKNTRDTFDLVIPTKYELEFIDENYEIRFKNFKDQVNFSLKEMKTYFITPGSKWNKFSDPMTYLKKGGPYITVNELETEACYISDCVYGYITFLIRIGVNVHTTDISNIVNMNENELYDEEDIDYTKKRKNNTFNHNTHENIKIQNVAETEEDNRDGDTSGDDDSDSEEDSNEEYDNDPTFYTKLDGEEYTIDELAYPHTCYSKHDNESKRVMAFKYLADDTYNIVANSVNTDSGCMEIKPPKFIKDEEDIKRTIVLLHFNDNIEKMEEFNKKYMNKKGFYSKIKNIDQLINYCSEFYKH